MKNLFANTKRIMGFFLRRDRLSLSLWLVSLSAFFLAFVPLFQEILSTTKDMGFIEESMKNPAMVAMLGPFYATEGYNLGSLYSSYMLLYSAILVGIMNIFFVSRHTRAQEEEGQWEMLRALPIGRLSNISGTFFLFVLVNLALGLIATLGLSLLYRELNFLSCLVFGGIIFSIGNFFGAMTLFLAQIFTSNKSLLGASFFLLFLFYVLRAIGDIYWELLSLISPLGLMLRSQNFVQDYLWPLGILLAESLVLILLTFALAKNRDLGEGLIGQRLGKRHGSYFLQGIYSFSWKLSKASIFLWIIVIASFASMYGSVFGDIESYIASSEIIGQIFKAQGEESLIDQVMAMLAAVMALISTIPVLQISHKILGEERKGYSQAILSKSVSKGHYLGSFFVLSLLLTLVLPLISALGFWGVGQYFLADIGPLEDFIHLSLSFVPAICLMLGISIFLIGIFPRIAWMNYLFLAYCFIQTYLGRLVDWPKALENLSPFGHVSSQPIGETSWETSLIMMGIFLLLSLAGFFFYKRRDLL